ncbi:MAG: hypothetical protein WCA39_05290 [Nitrososphaeraceae archaeon]
MEVTSEEVHDGKMLKKLIDNASENNHVTGVLADGMYNSNDNFRYKSKHHIVSFIKKQSKIRPTMNMSVLKQQATIKR